MILIIFLAGCTEYPSDQYRDLEDFRKDFPRKEYSELSKRKILTLSDAKKNAIKYNPDYQSAQRAVNAAKYRYYRSLSAYLPEVNFRADVHHSLKNSHDLLNPPAGVMPRENNLSAGLGVYASLLVFDGLEREFSVLAAKQEYRRKKELDRNAKRLLIRAVAYAYYDAVLAKEAEKIARADLEFQQSSLRQAENRYRNGLVSKAAVLNFRILANSAKQAILNARYRGIIAKNSICALMGFPLEDFPGELELSPLKEPAGNIYEDLGTCLELAAANRPDLRAAAFLLDITWFQKWSAYSAFLPVIRAETGLDFSAEKARYGGYRFRKSHHNTTDFYYGIGGEWNLFRGFSSWNQIRERRVQEELARLHLKDVFLNAVNEVKDAFANYRNAVEQVSLCRETVQWVHEQRDLVQSEFWCGHNTITRLNGAQSDLVEAESRLAIAVAELCKAAVQLNAAMDLDDTDGSAERTSVPQSP